MSSNPNAEKKSSSKRFAFFKSPRKAKTTDTVAISPSKDNTVKIAAIVATTEELVNSAAIEATSNGNSKKDHKSAKGKTVGGYDVMKVMKHHDHRHHETSGPSNSSHPKSKMTVKKFVNLFKKSAPDQTIPAEKGKKKAKAQECPLIKSDPAGPVCTLPIPKDGPEAESETDPKTG